MKYSKSYLSIGAAVFCAWWLGAAHGQVVIEARPFRDPRNVQAAQTAQTRPPSDQPFEWPIEPYVEPRVTRAPSGRPTGAKPQVETPAAAPSVTAIATANSPAVKVWAILPSDGYVSRALSRWASSGDGTLPVLWSAHKDIPAVKAVYSGDFMAALEKTMIDSQNGDFPVHACVYDNVVRILHTSQACIRNKRSSEGAPQ